jgi:kumamolisin
VNVADRWHVRRVPLAGAAVALLVLVALATLGGARPARASTLDAARNAAPANAELNIVLPLVARSAALRRYALAVSTPGTPLYGRYASLQTLALRYGAPRSTRERVLAYLRSRGAHAVRIDATGELAEATMSVTVAEHVFGTRLALYRTGGGIRFIAPVARGARAAGSAQALPAGLRGLATGVIGLDNRPVVTAPAVLRATPERRRAVHANVAPSSELQRTGTPSGCPAALATGGFTPNQYLNAYGYSTLQGSGTTGAGERVALIEIDGFKASDIATFAQCFGLAVPTISTHLVGVAHALAPGGETTLDLEMLDAAAPSLTSIDVYEASADSSADVREFAAPLQNPAQLPAVMSVSVGLCEQDTLLSVGDVGLNAIENVLATATAAGVTVVAASGDNGSADCLNAKGNSRPKLAVNYPSSSWWVTSVGGTNLSLDADNNIAAETVWNDEGFQPQAAGGGGASVLFGRPPYQDAVVSGDAREVPDVAMLADLNPGYATYCTARPSCVNRGDPHPWQAVGGTSAGTPLLAGGVALIDELLSSDGRESVGLLNPLLYELGDSADYDNVFNDVTQYNNDVGAFIPRFRRGLGCCSAGPGYDMASGWGSVKLAALAAQATALLPASLGLTLTLPAGQTPIHAGEIAASVGCAVACTVDAYADVTVGGRKPFEIRATPTVLGAPGAADLTLTFTSRQLARMRAAHRDGRRITASVVGVSVSGTGAVNATATTTLLVIRS